MSLLSQACNKSTNHMPTCVTVFCLLKGLATRMCTLLAACSVQQAHFFKHHVFQAPRLSNTTRTHKGYHQEQVGGGGSVGRRRKIGSAAQRTCERN